MPGGRLTQQERRQIALGVADGLAYAEIARSLDRPTSTITREVMRNGGPAAYRADLAHRATEQRAHRRKRATPRDPGTPSQAHGRDTEAVRAYEEVFGTVFMQSGLPRMTARVLAALYTTDAGSLGAAELAGRLQVSPATVSKAIAFLDDQGLIRRERDERRRERYVVDDDVLYQSTMASARATAHLGDVARQGSASSAPAPRPRPAWRTSPASSTSSPRASPAPRTRPARSSTRNPNRHRRTPPETRSDRARTRRTGHRRAPAGTGGHRRASAGIGGHRRALGPPDPGRHASTGVRRLDVRCPAVSGQRFTVAGCGVSGAGADGPASFSSGPVIRVVTRATTVSIASSGPSMMPASWPIWRTTSSVSPRVFSSTPRVNDSRQGRPAYRAASPAPPIFPKTATASRAGRISAPPEERSRVDRSTPSPKPRKKKGSSTVLYVVASGSATANGLPAATPGPPGTHR